MDDPFSNPSLFDPFSRTGERRDVTITSEPVVLEVKPLPPNPPANFDGAVGTFTMNVEANPKTVQTGDPITVTATITGRGNFDRLNAPALEDEHGWHTYPSNGKFKQDDDVGISGVKTFETVVSPNEKKTALPPLLFSYFDAAKEKYVTLRSEPVPIRVEGAAIATASAPPPASKPSAASSAAASAAPSPPQPAAKPADILYQVNERPARLQSFRPLYLQPAFWAAQIPPLLGLIGFVGIKLRQRRRGDERAARTAAWQREVSELMRRLRQSRESASQYFADASRAVQLKAALARGLDPNSVDLDTAAAAFNLDEPARTQLRQLFERRDEMRYSGGSANGELSDDKRRGILYFIENLKT
jgi:hypothetical protein